MVACALIPPSHVSDIDPEPRPTPNIDETGIPNKLREGPEVHRLLSSQRVIEQVPRISAEALQKPLQRSKTDLTPENDTQNDDDRGKK